MRFSSIATSFAFAILSFTSFANPNNYATHVVKWGETFYSVARTYSMDRGDLQKINSLVDLHLKEGQVLRVILPAEKSEISNPITDDYFTKKVAKSTVSVQSKSTNDYESIYYQYIYSGMRKQVESGNITVDASINASIVYYNHAPVGSIVKLINKENNLVVYAKVLGRLDDSEKEVATIKVSEKVAKDLFFNDKLSLEIASYSEN